MTEEKQKKDVEAPKSGAPEAHVSKFKKRVVEDIIKLMKEYPIIGALNMENMPTASLQKMRAQLRETVVMRMTKRRLMQHAFDEAMKEKKGLEKLVPYLIGMPALIFTKENPFKLFKTLKKNKSPAAAKPGQTAPKDIKISAGPTPFVPGPIIGELGAVGLKTEVKEGKIHIKEDSIIVKEGEEINADVASMLLRLGIEPMEIGLDLVAIYEDGVIYDKKVLDIDEDVFLQSLSDASTWALNLAVEVGYYTKETVEILVPKAFNEAKAVALEGNILADAVLEEVLAKAENQAKALKTEAGIEVGVAKEVKEEPKVEEKKEEPKPEPPKEEPEPKAEEPKQAEQPKEEEKPVEEKKEEVKPEPVVEEKPVEEPPKEEPKEEPKVEEKPVEEPQPEPPKPEPVVEEPKEEPKPEPELPSTEKVITEAIKKNEEAKKEAETPKPEPKPTEGSKVELPSTEKVITEAIKKNEEAKKEAETRKEIEKPVEKVEREEKEVKQELKEIQEEVKEEAKDPSVEGIKNIEEDVEKVEEKLVKVDIEKQALPAKEKIIILDKKEAQPIERQIDPAKQKMAREGEKLYEQLKKEGTLRNVEKEAPKPSGPMSPQDIIANAHKKMEDKNNEGKSLQGKELQSSSESQQAETSSKVGTDEIPSAHDLLKKKLRKEGN